MSGTGPSPLGLGFGGLGFRLQGKGCVGFDGFRFEGLGLEGFLRVGVQRLAARRSAREPARLGTTHPKIGAVETSNQAHTPSTLTSHSPVSSGVWL